MNFKTLTNKMEINGRLNPWAVSRIEEFLFFCCPECNERIQSRNKFIQHALKKHKKSRTYLAHISDIPPSSRKIMAEKNPKSKISVEVDKAEFETANISTNDFIVPEIPLLTSSAPNRKPNILSKSRENKKSKVSLLKTKIVDKKEVKKQSIKRKSLMEISPSTSEIKIKTEPCDDDFQVDDEMNQLELETNPRIDVTSSDDKIIELLMDPRIELEENDEDLESINIKEEPFQNDIKEEPDFFPNDIIRGVEENISDDNVHMSDDYTCICDFCGFETLDNEEFKNHMCINTPLNKEVIMGKKSKEPFIFSFAKRASTGGSYERPGHGSEREPQWPCGKCDQLFKKSSELQEHIMNFHNLKQDFKCEVCGKILSSQRYMKKHVEYFHNNKERKK